MAPVGDPSDPEGFWSLMLRFLEHMRVRNYSEHTVELRQDSLVAFFRWCLERGLARPCELTRPILERYQRYLFHFQKRDGQPLSFRSQHIELTAIRTYFQWLARENVLLHNPASELLLPRVEKRLPRRVLTVAEVESVLALPDPDTPLGLRDRAILETFYATGMRRQEVARLGIYDVDRARATVTVRQGKGKKDRVVPMGERALAWAMKYLLEVRPTLVVRPGEPALFLTHLGDAFLPESLSYLVKTYVRRSGLGNIGACHLFRHTAATLMMEGGADLRSVQEILGHASPTTTQIYTQVTIARLKEIHAATHPGARFRPVRAPRDEDEVAVSELDDAEDERAEREALEVEEREGRPE